MVLEIIIGSIIGSLATSSAAVAVSAPAVATGFFSTCSLAADALSVMHYLEGSPKADYKIDLPKNLTTNIKLLTLKDLGINPFKDYNLTEMSKYLVNYKK